MLRCSRKGQYLTWEVGLPRTCKKITCCQSQFENRWCVEWTFLTTTHVQSQRTCDDCSQASLQANQQVLHLKHTWACFEKKKAIYPWILCAKISNKNKYHVSEYRKLDVEFRVQFSPNSLNSCLYSYPLNICLVYLFLSHTSPHISVGNIRKVIKTFNIINHRRNRRNFWL